MESNHMAQTLGSYENPYDLIISGAGPVGLAAAIIAGRAEMKVLILEQADKPAPLPRGETVHDHPIFTELMGQGVLKSLALNQTADRLFFSPNALKKFKIKRKSPSIVFEWEKFIKILMTQAENTGITIQTQKQVLKPIIQESRCVGVVLSDGTQYYGHTVLACDGHRSALGKEMNIPYETLNCLIAKRLVSNYSANYTGFSYYFIPAGSLDYAPRFPPGVIFNFPRQSGHTEVGFMIFTSAALRIPQHCDLPTEDDMLRVWHRLLEDHPHFSDLMKNTKLEFEYITSIPVAKLFEPAMPIPGLIFLGDSAGFVEASGASGISAGLQAAKFAVNYCYNRPNTNNYWTSEEVGAFLTAFSESKIYKHVHFVYKFTLWFQATFFARLRTAKQINRFWWFLKFLMSIKK
jgi:flavin-dependent dehydrogenase